MSGRTALGTYLKEFEIEGKRGSWRGWYPRFATPLFEDPAWTGDAKKRGEKPKLFIFDASKSRALNHVGYQLFTAWAVGERTPIVPLGNTDWFRRLRVSAADFETFSKALENPELSQSEQRRLTNAIKQLVLETSFPEFKTQWRDLSDYLRKMIAAGDGLLQLLSASMVWRKKDAFLPPAQTVLAALSSATSSERELKACRRNVKLIIERCALALEAIEPKITKRGKKGDFGLQHLARELVPIAAEKTQLPSNEKRDVQGATPLTRLMRAVISVAVREGTRVVSKSNLPAPKKKAALVNLRQIGSKSEGALIDQLRKAKQHLKKGG